MKPSSPIRRGFTPHKSMAKPRTGAGFTLIELLVVIAIIGLLATLAVVQFGASRSKARDAKRKADIVAIQKALELYYSANNQYPPSGGAIAPNNGWTNSNDASWNGLTTNLAPYLANLPKDPINDGPGSPLDGIHYSYTFFLARLWLFPTVVYDRL